MPSIKILRKMQPSIVVIEIIIDSTRKREFLPDLTNLDATISVALAHRQKNRRTKKVGK